MCGFHFYKYIEKAFQQIEPLPRMKMSKTVFVGVVFNQNLKNTCRH